MEKKYTCTYLPKTFLYLSSNTNIGTWEYAKHNDNILLYTEAVDAQKSGSEGVRLLKGPKQSLEFLMNWKKKKVKAEVDSSKPE